MKYIPRKYQTIADQFLREHDRGCLFQDMGLGKSVETLTVLEEYIYQDFRVNKVLIVAPKKVAEDTWSREAAKWDHLNGLRISLVLGTEKQRRKALETNADFYVINRENVQWLVEKWLPSVKNHWPFDAVVLDELSSFKNPHSKRWRMLKRVIGLSRIVWGLTGTPAPKGYEDLWAEIYLIDNGQRLGKTLGEYRLKYFSPGAHKGHIVYNWVLKHGAKDRIDNLLRDLCLSMSAEDWLELPDILFVDDVVHMTPEERKLYDRFHETRVLPLLEGQLAESLEDADHAVLGSTAATVSGKLLQMANGAVYDDDGNVFHIHDEKLEKLDEIAEAAQGENLLIYYSYQHDRERILQHFPEARELIGPKDIAAWNAGKIPVLIAHPASVAYGLNLQEGGHIIIWFGLTWSLELYQQANARLHRQGQTKPVVIHRILCADTLDQRVAAALSRKDAVQNGLLDALKEYLTDTTT